MSDTQELNTLQHFIPGDLSPSSPPPKGRLCYTLIPNT